MNIKELVPDNEKYFNGTLPPEDYPINLIESEGNGFWKYKGFVKNIRGPTLLFSGRDTSSYYVDGAFNYSRFVELSIYPSSAYYYRKLYKISDIELVNNPIIRSLYEKYEDFYLKFLVKEVFVIVDDIKVDALIRSGFPKTLTKLGVNKQGALILFKSKNLIRLYEDDWDFMVDCNKIKGNSLEELLLSYARINKRLINNPREPLKLQLH